MRFKPNPEQIRVAMNAFYKPCPEREMAIQSIVENLMDIREIKAEDVKPFDVCYRADKWGEREISVVECSQLPNTVIPIRHGDILDIQTDNGTVRVSVIQASIEKVVGVVWKE